MAGLPRDVRRFIADYINSVEQLEALLRMRDERDRTWSAADVARALSTSPSSADVRLRDLVASRLVEPDAEGYRYGPPEAFEPVIRDLADCYSRLRVRVISEIFSHPGEGVRSFSDAFRLKDDR